VLAVGISEYESQAGFPTLDSASSDAASIASIFEKQPAYKDVVTQILSVQEETSAQRIKQELERLMNEADGNDTVVFFFAGHGKVNEQGHFCIVPADGDCRELNTELLLREFCQKEKFRKLLILDTCHSGAALTVQQLARTNDREGWGANIFASSAGDQPAFEAAGGGIFTNVLVEGLTGDAWLPYGEPFVLATQLKSYVLGRLTKETGFRQIPILEIPDNEEPYSLRLTKAAPHYLKRADKP
jgi:uncharacterized caspase-like protein